MPVAAGPNRFTAEAVAEVGGLRSKRAVVTVTGAAVPKRPKLHLLAVAIDRYEDAVGTPPLRFPETDADALVDALEAQGTGLYEGVDVERIVGPNGTAEAVRDAFARVAAGADGNDTLVVFLAGHGTIIDDEYYYLTYGASLASDRSVRERGLSRTDLAALVKSVQVTRKILIVDTCHAGEFAEADTLYSMRGDTGQAWRALARGEGVTVWASTGADEPAAEVYSLGHGLFSYVLLAGLRGGEDLDGDDTLSAAEQRGADVDGDGFISVNEMSDFLDRQVENVSRRLLPTPQYARVHDFANPYPLVATQTRP